MNTTHAEMVRFLVKPGSAILKEMKPIDADLLHMVVGIAGESGELLDAIKKQVIYRKSLDLDNVIEELGDLEFYMEGLRQNLSITRSQCLDANMKKLGKRYPGFKYSDGSAQARSDKQ